MFLFMVEIQITILIIYTKKNPNLNFNKKIQINTWTIEPLNIQFLINLANILYQIINSMKY